MIYTKNKTFIKIIRKIIKINYFKKNLSLKCLPVKIPPSPGRRGRIVLIVIHLMAVGSGIVLLLLIDFIIVAGARLLFKHLNYYYQLFNLLFIY